MPLQPDLSENLQGKKRVGLGLPCANCGAYYAADLAPCPICGCRERVPVNGGEIRPTGQMARENSGVQPELASASETVPDGWKIRQTVSFDESAYSTMLQVQAVVELLEEKGLLNRHEVFERVKRLQTEAVNE